jgi:hypothetical protein
VACKQRRGGSLLWLLLQVLKRPPYGLLEGEFVRAECRVLAAADQASSKSKQAAATEAADTSDQQEGSSVAGPAAGAAARSVPVQCRVVRKDELLGPSNCVLLLQTNRKVSWQSGAARRHH